MYNQKKREKKLSVGQKNTVFADQKISKSSQRGAAHLGGVEDQITRLSWVCHPPKSAGSSWETHRTKPPKIAAARWCAWVKCCKVQRTAVFNQFYYRIFPILTRAHTLPKANARDIPIPRRPASEMGGFSMLHQYSKSIVTDSSLIWVHHVKQIWHWKNHSSIAWSDATWISQRWKPQHFCQVLEYFLVKKVKSPCSP